MISRYSPYNDLCNNLLIKSPRSFVAQNYDPHTGGLSGATPSEAVSWGKIDPAVLSRTVVSYGDCSFMLPFFVSYALNKTKKRAGSKLYPKKEKLVQKLKDDYLKTK